MIKKKPVEKYYISTHVSYNSLGKDTYGPPHAVYDFLISNKKKTIFIKHSLEGDKNSIVLSSKSKKIKGLFSHSSLVLRSLGNIIINIKEVDNRKNWFIGVDPINGLSGVILKKFGRTKKFIYFTPDYADKRFASKFINSLYHFIDRISVNSADELWSVSTRIVKKRQEQGVSDEKNKLLPNSPDFKKVPKRKALQSDNLIIVSHLSKSLNLQPVLKALKKLSKDNDKIHLSVVGSGPREEIFKSLVKKMQLGERVEFLGPLPHKEVLKLISKALIGFALYTNENSWNKYGDSMKAREYLAAGIPVIMNDVPSTAEDVMGYGAGLVIKKSNEKQIYDFIGRCIKEKQFYSQLRKRALLLAKDYDKSTILKTLFNQ